MGSYQLIRYLGAGILQPPVLHSGFVAFVLHAISFAELSFIGCTMVVPGVMSRSDYARRQHICYLMLILALHCALPLPGRYLYF